MSRNGFGSGSQPAGADSSGKSLNVGGVTVYVVSHHGTRRGSLLGNARAMIPARTIKMPAMRDSSAIAVPSPACRCVEHTPTPLAHETAVVLSAMRNPTTNPPMADPTPSTTNATTRPRCRSDSGVRPPDSGAGPWLVMTRILEVVDHPKSGPHIPAA